MTDLLIRDVPDDVIAAIDARARRLRESRTEYLRRVLARERSTATGAAFNLDLTRFADRFADLADPEVMRHAWG